VTSGRDSNRSCYTSLRKAVDTLSGEAKDGSMAEENKAPVRWWLDKVLTRGNLRRVDKPLAPNYLLHDPGVPQEVNGR
jgi:hypothetical protein